MLDQVEIDESGVGEFVFFFFKESAPHRVLPSSPPRPSPDLSGPAAAPGLDCAPWVAAVAGRACIGHGPIVSTRVRHSAVGRCRTTVAPVHSAILWRRAA